MGRLAWDEDGKRFFEAGVDHGVLYKKTKKTYGTGVVWNGLTAVNEAPSGGEPSPLYADNIKYLNLSSNEEFGGTIEAYTYPDEFAECDGSATIAKGVTISQQKRSEFAFSYRTRIGNDENDELGYKIHIVYGAKAKPAQKDRATINENIEAMTLSWEFTTTPVSVKPVTTDLGTVNLKPTAHLEIDTTKLTAPEIKKIEDALYGTDEAEPKLLMPDEIVTLLSAAAAAAVQSVPTKKG